MLFLLNPIFRIWIKITAISITVCFIFPYLTWAFDPGSYMPVYAPGLVKVQHLDRIVSLPKKLGAITKGFQGNGKMIVHIQDLHCNYDVQMNIARIIHLLAKNHGLRLVGEEGAFHTVNTSRISTFPMKKVSREVSDYFVKQGKLTGAEYYSGIGEHPIHLEGIETPDLYKASEQSVHSFLNYESQGYCYDLREIFDELKASIYNPLLKKFDAKRLAYRKGDLDLLEYCAYLRTTARRLKIPPFAKRGEGGDFSAYPNFSRFLSRDQKYFSEEVNPDQLFRELDALDGVIRGSLYTSDLQIEFDDLYRRLDIIEKLLNISAAPEDLHEFRIRRPSFAVRVFAAFIHRQDKTREYILDPEVYALDKYLNEVDKFYRIADERSVHFTENLLKKMGRFDEKLAVMITGGFHTEKVLQELKAKDISYVSIKPRLIRQDIINPYFSLLRNKKMPLEKFLSQNQNIMAVLTSCPDVRNFNTSEVVPLSAITNLSQRMFNKILGIMFHNAAIVTLRKRGNKIREIPGELDEIRNTYPGEDDSPTMDTAPFIRVNGDISSQFKDQPPPFIFIPMQDGNRKFNFIAAHDPKQLGISPDSILASDQMMEINGSQYHFYGAQNLSGLVKAMIKNRHSPMLIMLPPEMTWWAMFGFHGLLTRLAWEMVKGKGNIRRIAPSIFKKKETVVSNQLEMSEKEILQALDSGIKLLSYYEEILSDKGKALFNQLQAVKIDFEKTFVTGNQYDKEDIATIISQIPTAKNPRLELFADVLSSLTENELKALMEIYFLIPIMTIEIIKGCPNRCLHCFETASPPIENMPYPLALKLAKKIRPPRNIKMMLKELSQLLHFMGLIGRRSLCVYDDGDPAYYQDKYFKADLGDILEKFCQTIAKPWGVGIIVSMPPWPVNNQRIQKAVEKIISNKSIRSKIRIVLSAHFLHEGLAGNPKKENIYKQRLNNAVKTLLHYKRLSVILYADDSKEGVYSQQYLSTVIKEIMWGIWKNSGVRNKMQVLWFMYRMTKSKLIAGGRAVNSNELSITNSNKDKFYRMKVDYISFLPNGDIEVLHTNLKAKSSEMPPAATVEKLFKNPENKIFINWLKELEKEFGWEKYFNLMIFRMMNSKNTWQLTEQGQRAIEQIKEILKRSAIKDRLRGKGLEKRSKEIFEIVKGLPVMEPGFYPGEPFGIKHILGYKAFNFHAPGNKVKKSSMPATATSNADEEYLPPVITAESEPGQADLSTVSKGVIPGKARNFFVDKLGINPRLYENLIAPLWEEGVFTGVPIIIGLFCPPVFILALLVSRLFFLALHLTDARAPDGTWDKKALVSQLTLPLLISAIVALAALAAFNLAVPMLFALAVGNHILTNAVLQPLINGILEKLGVKLRLMKAAFASHMTWKQKLRYVRKKIAYIVPGTKAHTKLAQVWREISSAYKNNVEGLTKKEWIITFAYTPVMLFIIAILSYGIAGLIPSINFSEYFSFYDLETLQLINLLIAIVGIPIVFLVHELIHAAVLKGDVIEIGVKPIFGGGLYQRLFPKLFRSERSIDGPAYVKAAATSFWEIAAAHLAPYLVLTSIGVYLFLNSVFPFLVLAMFMIFFLAYQGILPQGDLILTSNDFLEDFWKDIRAGISPYPAAVKRRLSSIFLKEMVFSSDRKEKIKLRTTSKIFKHTVNFENLELVKTNPNLKFINYTILMILFREDRKLELPAYHMAKFKLIINELSAKLSSKDKNQVDEYIMELVKTISKEKLFTNADKEYFISEFKKLEKNRRAGFLGKALQSALQQMEGIKGVPAIDSIQPEDHTESLYGPNEYTNQRNDFFDQHPLFRRWAVMPLLGVILFTAQMAAALGLSVQPNLSYELISDKDAKIEAEKIKRFNDFQYIKGIKFGYATERKFAINPAIADRIMFKPFTGGSVKAWFQNNLGMLFGYSRLNIDAQGKMEISVPCRLLASLDLSDEPKSGPKGRLARLADYQMKRIVEHQTARWARLIRAGDLTRLGLSRVEEVIFYNELAALEEEQSKIQLFRDPENSMGRLLQQEKITVGPAEIIGIYLFLMKQINPGFSLINAGFLKEQLSLDTAKAELIEQAREAAKKNKGVKNPLDEHPYWADDAGINTMLEVVKTLPDDNLLKIFLAEFKPTDAHKLADMGAAALIISALSETEPQGIRSGGETNITELTTLALPKTVAEMMLLEISEIMKPAEEKGLDMEFNALQTALLGMISSQETEALVSKTGQVISFMGETAQGLSRVLSWKYAATRTKEAAASEITIAKLGKQIEVQKESVFAVATTQTRTINITVDGEELEAAVPLAGQIIARDAEEVKKKLAGKKPHILPFSGKSRIEVDDKQNALINLFDKFVTHAGLFMIKYTPSIVRFEMHIRILNIDPMNYIKSRIPEKVMENSTLAKQLMQTNSRFQELYLNMANAHSRKEFYAQQKIFINYMRKYMARHYYDIYGDEVIEKPEELNYISEEKMLENYWNLRFFHEIVNSGAIVSYEEFAALDESAKPGIKDIAPRSVSMPAVLAGGSVDNLKISYGNTGALMGFLKRHYYTINKKFENIFDKMRKRMHSFAGAA